MKEVIFPDFPLGGGGRFCLKGEGRVREGRRRERKKREEEKGARKECGIEQNDIKTSRTQRDLGAGPSKAGHRTATLGQWAAAEEKGKSEKVLLGYGALE